MSEKPAVQRIDLPDPDRLEEDGPGLDEAEDETVVPEDVRAEEKS